MSVVIHWARMILPGAEMLETVVLLCCQQGFNSSDDYEQRVPTVSVQLEIYSRLSPLLTRYYPGDPFFKIPS